MNRDPLNPIHSAGRRRGRTVVLALIAGSWFLVSPADSQPVRIQVNQGNPFGNAAESEESGLVPPQDRDAESWLKRAEEAAQREDWKLAADTLARVIREHGPKIVSLDDGKTYQSAGVCAQQQIAAWPVAGREAYRILFDGEAQRLMDKAVAAHDTVPLWALVREYPHSTQGPRAIELLAAWLLDLGRPGEASDALDRLALYSDERLPKWRELELRALVQATLRLPAATETLAALKKMTGVVKDLPPDWKERVDAIGQFRSEALAAMPLPQGDHGEPWTTPLGPASAHGHAPPVTPVVTPQMPWSDRLPGIDRVDEVAALRIIDATARSPVWRAVTDGRLLFYTGQTGLVARDLSTFDFVWQSVPLASGSDGRIVRNRQQLGFFPTGVPEDNRQRLDPHTARALFQEYAGFTTCAHGLVFQIEQPFDPGERLPTREGDSEPYPVTEGQAAPNSIRAFHADSGLTAWTLGRSGPVQDELRDAHFYSTPVAAGPNLIAPYERGHDFFLAVIRPDGRIEQKVHLGTGRSLMFPINGVLTPLVADGTIYVPTGTGMLAALAEADYSLRWLARYDRIEARTTGSRRRRQQMLMMGQSLAPAQPDEWVSTPPIAVGQTVLLAPQDSDKLIAFDRANGAVRWKSSRRRNRYIVGADETRVIVAGKEISAIRLADGAEEWEFNPSGKMGSGVIPSGRPVFAGKQILVPTDTGLITLDAATGEPKGERLVYEEALGNLMVAEGALYSISATSIVKFPDVTWTRARAQERLAENPADLDAAIRLAWLAALEKNWTDVLKLLDAASPDAASSGKERDGRLDRAAHLRVTALLRLAEGADTAEALALLGKANAAARQPSDVVDAGLALMDRLVESGDAIAALERGFSLLATAGNEAMHIESGLNGRASMLIGERLRRTHAAAQTDEHRERATQIVTAAIERAASAADRSVMTDVLGFRPESARLDMDAARNAQATGNIETAIFYLARAARRAGDTPLRAEALARWAMLLADPGEGLLPSPDAARAVLSQLASVATTEALPADIAGADMPSRDFVDRLNIKLAGMGPPAGFKPGGRMRVLASNTESAWVPQRSFDFQDGSDLLAWRQNRAIIGIPLRDSTGVRDGRSAWISGSAPFNDGQDAFSRPESTDTPSAGARSAARAERVAIFDTGPTFQAIGMSTGRCMWRPLPIDRSRGEPPTPSLAAVNGIAILAPDASNLVALPARDGAEPIWTRDFGRTRLGRLAAVGDSLIVMDREATRVFVIDPESGRITRQYPLTKSEPLNLGSAEEEVPPSYTSVAISGGVICRSEGKQVVARDIQTGLTVWDKVLSARVRGLQTLDANHLAVSYRGDKLAVVRSDSGEVIREITIDDLELPAVEIALEGRSGSAAGRLILFARTDDEPAKFKVAVYPLDGGEPTFQGPWDSAMVTRRMLTASPDYLAVVRYDRRTMDDQEVNAQGNLRIRVVGGRAQVVNGPDDSGVRGAGLWIYDKSKDLRRVARYEFTTQDAGSILYGAGQAEISDVVFAGESVIAFGPRGMCVLGPEGADKAGEAKSNP